ncbi:MAG: PA0069 family radical SAM protein [Planctomycetes bacterium]|nr:PA0069 family radical SAM protein [Planctomycetota bacterium]
MTLEPIKGRGAADNPPNRFELIRYEPLEDGACDERPAPATQFFRDATASIIATNDSPDVPFSASINPYRGCEHGCVYCYARPYHEYLGFSIGLDFETKIMVKEDAPRLLRKELNSKKWTPQILGMSGVTDCYQPIERRLEVTRHCLEVLAAFRNPVWIVTKNRLVTRDIDLLQALAAHDAAAVVIAVTTLDAELARMMEPRATTPAGRLQAIRDLTAAGIPTAVLMAPVIPGLTDHELPAVLAAARQAGAVHANYTMLRLPYGLPTLFDNWLDQHVPEKKDKVLSRIRAVRGGDLNDPRFGARMRGEGPIADAVKQMYKVAYKKNGFPGKKPLSTKAFRRPNDTPALLFAEG